MCGSICQGWGGGGGGGGKKLETGGLAFVDSLTIYGRYVQHAELELKCV